MRLPIVRKYAGDIKRKRRFLWFLLERANESGAVTARWLEVATIEYMRCWNYRTGFYWMAMRFIDQGI